MKRISSLVICLTLVMLFAGRTRIASPVLAQADVQSYQDPTFGFTIEWGDSWERMEDQTVTFDEGDVFALTSIVTGARLNLFVSRIDGRRSQSIADAYMQSISASRTNVETLVPTESDAWNGTSAYFMTYDLEPGIPADDYFEVRSYGSARLLADIRGVQPSGFLTGGSAVGELTIDGDPLFAYLSEVNPLSIYRSPTFGVALAYDPASWSEYDQQIAASNGGHDSLVLQSTTLPAALNLEMSAEYKGDMAGCLDAATTAAIGDLSAATPLLDANGNAIGDLYSDHAWVAYAFPSDKGDMTLNVFLECESLPEASGVFVLTLLSTEDAYAQAYNATLRILSSVDVTGETIPTGEEVGPRPDHHDDLPASGIRDDTKLRSSNGAVRYDPPRWNQCSRGSLSWGASWCVENFIAATRLTITAAMPRPR